MAATAPCASRARDIVMSHGWNATAYQVLNHGIRHWFDSTRCAVAGYVQRGSYLLAVGAPVCDPAILARVTQEFEEFARSVGCHVCYVCAGDRMRSLALGSRRHSIVTAGAQPVWMPSEWRAMVRSRASLRAQLRRALNRGVAIADMEPSQAAGHPELQYVLRKWLQCRGLPPMHFMAEPEVLRGAVDDRMVLAARWHGKVVAYLVASPVAARNGYLIEEIARLPNAPNGASELLIDAAMRRFAEQGNSYATMGLVALSRNVSRPNPFWLSGLMYVARAHANRFYNFRGIEQFRAKMQPRGWEEIYFISNEANFSPRALYAIGGAFSGISPIRAIGIAALKAGIRELRSLRRLAMGR
jgi:phosphatidylglycerol lysyltransferase